MNADTHSMYVANCRVCLLAEIMKDCKTCKFNVGLAERLFGHAYEQASEALTERDCLKLQYAAFCARQPVPAVDFVEIHEGLERVGKIIRYNPDDPRTPAERWADQDAADLLATQESARM